MAPKKETPDAPKTKRQMTPDQLEKLAVARARANEVRIAMKEGREDAQVAALQAKMNVLKAKKKQKDIIPTVPDNVEPPEPEPPKSTPTPDEETDSNKEDKVAKPAPAVEPVPESEPTQAGPPVEKLQCKKKTKKKPIIIVQNSESDSDSDDSNVIYIKKSSRKKKPEHVPPPQPPPPRPPPAQYHRPMPSNPFFNPMFSYGSRNFQ